MDLKNYAKSHMVSTAIKISFCLCLYSITMIYNLTNNVDGIWNSGYYIGGEAELSSGRWLIRFIDCLQLGIHANPFTTIITIVLFVIGTNLLIDIFNIKSGTCKDYIVSTLFLSNVIICVSVSYLYTSPTFGFAFLSSMVSVLCIVKAADNYDNTINVFTYCSGGAVSLAITMGLYQAYLGCTLLIMLIALIERIKNKIKATEIFRFIYCGLIVGIVGFLIYEILLHLNLFVFRTNLSSWNGIDNISLKTILINIVPSIKRTYIEFFKYFNGDICYWNALQVRMYTAVMLKVIVLFLIVMIIMKSIIMLKADMFRLILYLGLLAFIPVITGVTFILAPQSAYGIQQTAPQALVVSAVGLLLLNETKEQQAVNFTSKYSIKDLFINALLCAVLLGNTLQALTDQCAMREGYLSAETISRSIIQTLINDGNFDENKQYVFVGTPEGNPIFKVSPMYYKANGYTHVAGPEWGNSLSKITWNGILYNRCGVNLPLCTDRYEEVKNSAETSEMPIYPHDGSIRNIDGIIVIKVS